MAQCKDCIHFGICKKGFPWADGKGGGWCEDFLTSDVAPRAEVDELKRENESLAKTVNEASELIRKLKSKIVPRAELAREIFEEIENRLLPSNTSGEFRGDSIEWFDYYDLHLAEDIAELKKKYTE